MKIMTLVVNLNSEVYDVYIGRPSIWGNPFRLGFDGDRKTVIMRYEAWLYSKIANDMKFLQQIRRELRGKRLGCFCAPMLCHGDILARIANAWQTLPL